MPRIGLRATHTRLQERQVLFRGKTEDTNDRREAVAALYETHFERVARYIAVRIGNIDEAEDLASEVFIKAVRAAESYSDRGAPMEAWIFKIAHNITVDQLRKRSRRPAYAQLEDAEIIRDPQPTPDERLERQQEIRRLHAALEGLSDAQKQVISLRFGADMSSEQVAQVMGKKAGAVREMQSAAIKKLRERMQELEQDSEL